MPLFLFSAIVWAARADPALEVGEAIERVEGRHREEIDLFHLLDDGMGKGKRGTGLFLLH
ncbi:MAG: hypothetical protein HOP32_00750 [Nitrospira sp.]|nr:hypothetical protein [Nitrospira sp.]